MSSILPVPGGGLFPSRLDRQVARLCDHVDARAAVGRRSDQVQIERMAATTEYAMGAAAHLATVEDSLATIAPEARHELRAIRIAGTIGIAGVVADARFGR